MKGIAIILCQSISKDALIEFPPRLIGREVFLTTGDTILALIIETRSQVMRPVDALSLEMERSGNAGRVAIPCRMESAQFTLPCPAVEQTSSPNGLFLLLRGQSGFFGFSFSPRAFDRGDFLPIVRPCLAGQVQYGRNLGVIATSQCCVDHLTGSFGELGICR